MEENELMVLEVDISEAERSVEDLEQLFDSIGNLAADIGKEMAKAFSPLQKIIQKNRSKH